MDGHYFHAFCLPGLNVIVVERFYYFWTDGSTDTMCENNDHLIGRGLMGQYDILLAKGQSDAGVKFPLD